MPPVPTRRGSANIEVIGGSQLSFVVTVTSPCVGQYQQLFICASEPGSGDLPAISSITGGGVTGFKQIAQNTHTGPRKGRIVELTGVFTGGDITVTFAGNVDSFDAVLVDWSGVKVSKPCIHIVQTTSLNNQTDRDAWHQHVAHPNNVVVVLLLNGAGNNLTSLKSDEVSAGAGTLFQGTRATGEISDILAYRVGGFTNDSAGIQWTGGTFSNLFLACEIQDPASDDGSGPEQVFITDGSANSASSLDTASISGLEDGDILEINLETYRTGKEAEMERFDAGTTSGNGGGLGIAAAVKMVAGTFGATTATMVSAAKAFLSIALKPKDPRIAPYVPVNGVGTGAAGAADTTIVAPSGHATNDIELLFVESDVAITLDTANGFVEVTGSPQTETGATTLAVYWRRYSGQSDPIVNDPGAGTEHIYGVIIAFRGCIESGNPWDITVGGNEAADTSLSATGGTTTVDRCLVVIASSRDNDSAGAAFSAWANADLDFEQDPTSVVIDPAGVNLPLEKIGIFNIDSEHTLHRYALKVGSTPPTGIIRVTMANVQLGWSYIVTKIQNPEGSTALDWFANIKFTRVAASTSINSSSLGTLRRRSGVSAFAGKDNNVANFTPEPGYVPTAENGDFAGTGSSNQTMLFGVWAGSDWDNTPGAIIAASADLAMIALEVLGPLRGPLPEFYGVSVNPADGGSLSATSVTVTPPAGMIPGDLVWLMGAIRDETTSIVWSLSNDGGQLWTPISDSVFGFSCSIQRWWCVFDGTWDANPVVAESGVSANAITGAMLVFRPSVTAKWWGFQGESDTFISDASSPFQATWPISTVTREKSVRIVEWAEAIVRAMTLSATLWQNPDGVTEWTNLAGSDLTIALAYAIGQAAGSIEAVTEVSGTGPITQPVNYQAFYEIPKAHTIMTKSQARRRASRW